MTVRVVLIWFVGLALALLAFVVSEQFLVSSFIYAQPGATGDIAIISHNPRPLIGHEDLDDIIITVRTDLALTPSDIVTDCETDVILLSQNRIRRSYEYTYSLELREPECQQITIGVGVDRPDVVSLDLTHYADWLQTYLDTPSSEVVQKNREAIARIWELSTDEYPLYSSGRYELGYVQHEHDILREILFTRADPQYISPVRGVEFPEKSKKLPNTGRPYRARYTDGIHHGIDFDAPQGTPVRALGRGIILYIKDDFVWSEFLDIDYTPATDDQRLLNLHILRGNQIWLMTMTGDIFIYSHLDNIPTTLGVGDMVAQGEHLGYISSTGVPEKAYDDFHLHMAMMVNPLDPDMIWQNTLLDIMGWDWYGKGKSHTEVIEWELSLFSEDHLN